MVKRFIQYFCFPDRPIKGGGMTLLTNYGYILLGKFGPEIFWTTIYNYTYQLLYWCWAWKYLDYKYGLQLYFTGFLLENNWITNLDFNCYLWIWSWKYLDYEFGLRLLDFNWVWTWKYLGFDLVKIIWLI